MNLSYLSFFFLLLILTDRALANNINNIISNFQNNALTPGKESTVPNYDPNYSGPDDSDLEGQASREFQTNNTARSLNSYFVNNDFAFSGNEAVFNQGKSVINNPQNDLLSGYYSGCDDSGEIQSISLTDTQPCDQYKAAQNNICEIPRVVEVESNYNYSCTKELSYTTKTCSKTLNVQVSKEPLTQSHFGTYYLKPSNWPYNSKSWTGSYQSSGSKLTVAGISSTSIGCRNNLSPIKSGDNLYIVSTGNGSNSRFSGVYSVKGISYSCSYYNSGWGWKWYNNIVTITLSQRFNSNITNSIFYIKKQTSSPPAPVITSNWEEICQ